MRYLVRSLCNGRGHRGDRSSERQVSVNIDPLYLGRRVEDITWGWFDGSSDCFPTERTPKPGFADSILLNPGESLLLMD